MADVGSYLGPVTPLCGEPSHSDQRGGGPLVKVYRSVGASWGGGPLVKTYRSVGAQLGVGPLVKAYRSAGAQQVGSPPVKAYRSAGATQEHRHLMSQVAGAP